MGMWSRVVNAFRGERVAHEIDEEMRAHVEEAIAHGRDGTEARRALGAALQQREQSRDIRVAVWLDSLRADAVFGWRQLWKRKVTSASAILSLGIAIGACTSAFRLIDALLLRPLPVANAGRLYSLARVGVLPNGRPGRVDSWAYPSFRLMREAAKGQAELIAASYAEQADVTYGASAEIEKPYLQFVSGWMFDVFGLRPALGRVFTENDDLKPGAHPYTVLSYDYWTRRFARDRNVVGQTFRLGTNIFEIVGVCAPPFTGTEPGTVTDIFLPTMMNPAVVRNDNTWVRTMAVVQPGVALEPLRAKLHATSYAFEEARARGFTNMPASRIAAFLNQKVVLEPAASGVSGLQSDYRVSLIALGVLVALVLLIVCANVANLMSAQAAARAREMALRVSIGAGRTRLVQMVLVESAWLAGSAAAVGALFASWSAPFVVSRINPADNPARLSLPADARVMLFGLGLTIVVMLLFGLAPALRASAVRPASALKGGDDPHSRRRGMHVLIAAQAAFCFVVLFVAGLFAATFERLTHVSPGFSSERLLAIEAVTEQPQPPAFWDRIAERLRTTPGVESAALSDSALMNGYARNNFISINGTLLTETLAYFRYTAPGWLGTMKIPLIDGRDFRPEETSPGAAIVNQTFVRTYLPGRNAVGTYFTRGKAGRCQIVGVARDAVYRSLREEILPVAYVPLNGNDRFDQATFVVRTASPNPMSMANVLRREVTGARVRNVIPQAWLVQRQTVRERLLAMLALFFACVALLLAGVGLYGVLDYSVVQRRREIGIRISIGAQPSDIARRVTGDVFAMVLAGGVTGLALALVSARYVASVLFQVKATELGLLAVPPVAMFAAVVVAAVPAVIRAVRIDPVTTLRSE